MKYEYFNNVKYKLIIKNCNVNISKFIISNYLLTLIKNSLLTSQKPPKFILVLQS